MSIEGFLLKRKKYKTRHNMYQLVIDKDIIPDFDVINQLLNRVGDIAEDENEIWTVVPPSYRWELVK